jgi:hypothetical protein
VHLRFEWAGAKGHFAQCLQCPARSSTPAAFQNNQRGRLSSARQRDGQAAATFTDQLKLISLHGISSRWISMRGRCTVSESAPPISGRLATGKMLAGPSKGASRQAVSQAETNDKNKRYHCRSNHQNIPGYHGNCIQNVVTRRRHLKHKQPSSNALKSGCNDRWDSALHACRAQRPESRGINPAYTYIGRSPNISANAIEAVGEARPQGKA